MYAIDEIDDIKKIIKENWNVSEIKIGITCYH